MQVVCVAIRRYQIGAQTKTDLQVHLIWIPKYRKLVLIGQVAVQARDILRQIAIEHEIDIITGKVASEVLSQLFTCKIFR